MSNAIMGTGILLKVGDGAVPEVFTTIAEIVALKPPAWSRNEVDVSNHNEGRDAKLLGMLRLGQCTATINWIPTDATHGSAPGGLLHKIKNNLKGNWQVALPEDEGEWTFPGRVQLLDPQEVTVDSPLQAAIAITLDGDIVES